MLACIAYCVGTFVVGLFLAFVAGLFVMGPSQRLEKPYKLLMYSLVFTMTGPFVYCEALTKLFGEPMGHAVRACFNASPIEGSLDYYRVTKYNGDEATALAIASEKEGWGGTDRPILQIQLSRKGTTWTADSYKVLYSSRLNKDGLDFPPYQ
jgi:hypothetical protein